ncbi:hypothetical protein [Amycolatopsis sp. NPDC059021]|uniref:hypothetical protein n=1 Tax=Amycolatopsis sp. NPDC059021 TaxID=3346704 RepID=UPI00366C9CF7
MTTSTRERFVLYGIFAAVLLILMGLGLLIGRTGQPLPRTHAKADQLIAALTIAGTRPPAREQVVRVLGDDGGAVCANPDDALLRAASATQLANGAGGPGTRPVIADRRLVVGETLVITTYCPDKLRGFEQSVSRLRTAETAGG